MRFRKITSLTRRGDNSGTVTKESYSYSLLRESKITFCGIRGIRDVWHSHVNAHTVPSHDVVLIWPCGVQIHRYMCMRGTKTSFIGASLLITGLIRFAAHPQKSSYRLITLRASRVPRCDRAKASIRNMDVQICRAAPISNRPTEMAFDLT